MGLRFLLLALALPHCESMRVISSTDILMSINDTDAGSHFAGKSACALFCHLPPPWHQWRPGFDDKCDVDTSLFLDTDKNPLAELKDAELSGLDLIQVILRAMWTGESESQAIKDLAARYQVLKDDIDTVQGVLYGKVFDLEKTNKASTANRKLTPVFNSWELKGSLNEARCIAISALDEVKRLQETRYFPQPIEYEQKRGLCSNVKDVTMYEVTRAKTAVENTPGSRTEKIAKYGGKEQLLQELDHRLPPASAPCHESPEQCMASRFVSVTDWTPPTNLHHHYGNIIFVGCNHAAITRNAVETAMQIVAPGGNIMISGFTPQQVEEINGVNPFDVLLTADWTQSDLGELDDFGGAQVTVFTPP